MLSITVEHLSDTYGLTCVENHFAAIMRFLGLPYRAAYIGSYVQVYPTVIQFYETGIAPVYFTGLPRMQITAGELKLAELDYIDHLPADKLMAHHLPDALSRGIPLLVRVDPTGLPNPSGVYPMRDDHHVAVIELSGSEVVILDDYPLRSLTLSVEQFLDAYRSQIRIFRCLDAIDWRAYRARAQAYRQEIRESAGAVPDWSPEQLIPTSSDLVAPFRDAISVLRTSRRRLREWLAFLDELEGTQRHRDAIKQVNQAGDLLEQVHILTEVYRLRRNADYKRLIPYLENVKTAESGWLDKLYD